MLVVERSPLPNNGGPLFLDHTGATLYNFDYAGIEGNNTYEAYNVVKSNGDVTYVNEAGDGEYIMSRKTADAFDIALSCNRYHAIRSGIRASMSSGLGPVYIQSPRGTGADHLRHTNFVGLRDDKEARQIVRETCATAKNPSRIGCSC